MTEIIQFLTNISTFVGWNFFELPSWNPRCICVNLFLGFSSCLIIYTVFLDWPDPVKLFQSTMPFSYAIVGVSRLILITADSQPVIRLRNIIEKFYANIGGEEKVARSITSNCLNQTTQSIKVITVIYTACFYGPVLYSVTNFLVNNSFITPLPIIIPFLNAQSSLTFFVNISLQTWMSTIAFIGFLSNDGQTILYMFHMKAFIERFEIEMDHFRAALYKKEDKRSVEA